MSSCRVTSTSRLVYTSEVTDRITRRLLAIQHLPLASLNQGPLRLHTQQTTQRRMTTLCHRYIGDKAISSLSKRLDVVLVDAVSNPRTKMASVHHATGPAGDLLQCHLSFSAPTPAITSIQYCPFNDCTVAARVTMVEFQTFVLISTPLCMDVSQN